MDKSLTCHATKRLRQRGIDNKVLTYLLENGNTEYAPGGSIKIFITRQNAQMAISKLKKKIKLIEKAIDKNIIEKNGKIITIYHNTR